MLCVSVSNFSIYVYPNKTFIGARTLWRFRHSFWLYCLQLLLLLTLKTTSTIFASSIPSHPTLPLPLDHGQTLLHVHHLVLRWRRAWRKRLHMKRMRMLVLLMRRRSPGKQCWSLLHAQRYMRWTHICCGELQSETVVRHMMLSRRASRWTRRHTIGPMHILQYRWRDVGETLWLIEKKHNRYIIANCTIKIGNYPCISMLPARPTWLMVCAIEFGASRRGRAY